MYTTFTLKLKIVLNFRGLLVKIKVHRNDIISILIKVKTISINC